MRRRALAGALAVSALSAAVAWALVDEFRASGAEASAASRVAIEAAGGVGAALATPNEPGEAWRFHVYRADGTSEDVSLDRDLRVVSVGPLRAAASEAPTDAPGSRPIAQAEPPRQSAPARFLAPWTPVSAADAERAARAALDAVGGGTVHDVDRDLEGGATWEVELTTTDGRFLEVQLDAAFKVLASGRERDGHEGHRDTEEPGDQEDDD